MEENFLRALLIALLAASVIAALMHRLRQSLLIGYLFAGVLIGPSGLALVRKNDVIQDLAEVGVIMLMFTLGAEFSLSQLKRLKKAALLGGSIQLWGTMLLVGVVFGLVYHDWYGGFFTGSILAISSTVIVLKLLQEGGGLRSAHGTAALGISIYQDVMVVPLMLVLAAFGGRAGSPWSTLGESLGKSAVFLGVSWLASRFLAGRFLEMVARTRSKELFTISSVVLCLGIAWLAQSLGLSLALGAFVAGLLVSSSIYSHKILSDVSPFRDCFLSLFFISIGMLVDVGWAFQHLGEVMAWSWAGIVAKAVICSVACLVCGFSIRSSLLAGFCLAEAGEFSFVILLDGVRQKVITQDRYQLLLAVILVSLVAVPALWKAFGRWATWISQRPLLQSWEAKRYAAEAGPRTEPLRDHVVLVGCGPFGQVVLQALHLDGVTSVVLDLNPDTIRHLQKAGYNAVYGEAGNHQILELLQIERARAMVVTIPDLHAAEAIIREAREQRPDLPILARACFAPEVQTLRKAGATQVVYEEMEAASEMARILERRLSGDGAREKVASGARAMPLAR